MFTGSFRGSRPAYVRRERPGRRRPEPGPEGTFGAALTVGCRPAVQPTLRFGSEPGSARSCAPLRPERKLDGPPLTRGTEPKGPQASEVNALVSACRNRTAGSMMRATEPLWKSTQSGNPIPSSSLKNLNFPLCPKNRLSCADAPSGGGPHGSSGSSAMPSPPRTDYRDVPRSPGSQTGANHPVPEVAPAPRSQTGISVSQPCNCTMFEDSFE